MSSAQSMADTSLGNTRPSSLLEVKQALEERFPENIEPSTLQPAGLPDPEKAEKASSSPSNHDARAVHGLKWVLLCISLYITCFLYGLDTTIAADVQASVVETFGDVQQLTWMGTGFPLGSVAIILLVGSLYGKFDQKWIFVGSLVLFEAGSVLCGAAPSMIALIVGRIIAGMGGAGIYLGSLNYFSELTSSSERGAYISGIGLVWGLGCICGPLIGGAFSISSATWRWAFYINLPIAGVFAPVYLFFLPSNTLSTGTTWQTRLVKIDWLGFLLSAGVWVSFTLVLTFAGNTWPWNDGRTIALFIVFGALLAFFVAQQYTLFTTTKTDRLLPMHLLASRTQTLLYIATSAAISGVFVPIYYLPLYFQFTSDDTALLAAVRLLPYIILFVITNMASGSLLPRIGYYAALYLAAGLFLVASGAAFMTVTPTTPGANVYGFSILAAIGAGLVCQIGYSVATIKAPNGSEVVNAISLQNVSQIGSTVIALVISGQIFQSVAFRNLDGVLAGQGFGEDEIRAAVAGTTSAVFERLTGELRAEAVEAITAAMGTVYALLIVSGGVLVLSSAAMRWERIAA